MAQPPDLPNLPLGYRIQDPLLVLAVEQRYADEHGYTVLTLGNSTGRIASAPFWVKDQPVIAGLQAGDCVQVIGQVTSYRNRRQLQVSSIRPLPSSDWRGLMPSAGDIDAFWHTIEAWRSELSAPWGRLVALFLEDEEIRHRFTECPERHHPASAFLGGLLRHVVELGAVARSLARVRRADMDLVVVGTLLHDLGKIEGYTWERGKVGLTEAGRLKGIRLLSAQLVERRAGAPSPPPLGPDVIDRLVHLILAQPDGPGGSLVEPQTPEASILAAAHRALADTQPG